MSEVDRIQEAYRKRDRKPGIYSFFNTAARYAFQRREDDLIQLLERLDLGNLSSQQILDVGCGTGSVLRDFLRYGASPENLHGVDLLADRIVSARRLAPALDFRLGNAENLPYEDGSMDLILLFTVFTSIFDTEMKRKIAAEALRVLRPSGVIIYYDYKYSNPRNPDVRGVSKGEVKSLFPGCRYHFRLVTLAPPLSRRIAPYSTLLCRFLEKLPFLRTHYFAAISRQNV
jgi:SAM-dependent methyltransferase